ncbi:MAG TPA: ABC transporter substrate-binding protein [Acidimicrobiia bacterium]|nr:ABC transporter substrate-binding protein [Acidimicrobiia bacterium]
MRRSSLLLAALLTLAACGTTGGGDATTTVVEPTTTTDSPVTTTTAPVTSTTAAEAGFPVTISADNGEVTIEEMPDSIVSLSTVATEMLFVVGAGDQVVAVDDQSNYPEEAPTTDLSGFTPNVEAILAYEPDIVFISYDPGELVASLEAAGVPVVSFGAAVTLDDTYRQIEAIGAATGHLEEAIVVSEAVETELSKIADEAPEVEEGTSYFHEIDANLYTVTSSTFFGQIYSLFGLENIADPADEDGAAFGYPQLSSEFLVAADPDLIFLADSLYGESAETVAARPGWDVLRAVQGGNVYELDSDIASRWGPRIVDFAQAISDALEDYSAGS